MGFLCRLVPRQLLDDLRTQLLLLVLRSDRGVGRGGAQAGLKVLGIVGERREVGGGVVAVAAAERQKLGQELGLLE